MKLFHLFASAMSGGWYDADWKYILRLVKLRLLGTWCRLFDASYLMLEVEVPTRLVIQPQVGLFRVHVRAQTAEN